MELVGALSEVLNWLGVLEEECIVATQELLGRKKTQQRYVQSVELPHSQL